MIFSSESLRRVRPKNWQERLSDHGLITTTAVAKEDNPTPFAWSAQAGAPVRPETGEAFICGTTQFDPLETEGPQNA